MEAFEAVPSASGSGATDFMNYVRLFWRRRWVVLPVMATVVAGMALYLLRQPKVYQAQVAVIIDVTAPRFLDSAQVQDVSDSSSGNYWYNHEYYETQHKVIVSRAVATRVVEKLGLQNDAAFLGLEGISDSKSRAEAMKTADAPAILQAKIHVDPVKDSRLVHIIVEELDPQRAALLANEVAEAYMAENLSLKLKVTDSASQWLEERLGDLETRSKKSEMSLFDFKKQADVLSLSLDDRQNMVSQQLISYNTALTEVRTKLAALKAKVEAINLLRKDTDKDPKHWAEGLSAADTTIIQDLKLRVFTQESECAELSERYLPDHPKLQGCRQKLQAAEESLTRELSNIVKSAEIDLAQMKSQEKNLSVLFESAKSDAFDVNKKQIEYDRLKRDSDNNQRLYDLVLKRLKDIELSGLLRTSNVRVLDAARPVTIPVRPDVRKLMLLALMFGLLAGFGVALGLEVLDNTVFHQEDVEQRLGLPFLGMVPTLPEDHSTLPGNRDLYIHLQPKSSVAECCRAIRTNLLFMSPDKPFKTAVVTSSGPQEGKSFTVINLGIAMAQSGNRVLLMDTDMRRPRLHKAFGVPNEVGISSLVVGQGNVDDAIKSTEVPNLFVLPCGPIPPNPAELLHTRAFNELLKSLALKFDRILLDSPPINAVADAVVLSTQTDGTVMVLRAGRTNRELAKRAVRALLDVKVKMFGAVLNSVNLNDPNYGDYYYSYSRYGYYSGEKKDGVTS